MKLLIIAALLALLCALGAFYVLEPILKRLSARQTINELGPQNHISKQGALTMGGLGFLCVGAVLTPVLSLIGKGCIPLPLLYSVLCMLIFGAIGFLDDYLKVVRRRSIGLSVRQKLALQLAAALIMTLVGLATNIYGVRLSLPFTDTRLNSTAVYLPLILFLFVAVDNSANLLDGLDGLLSSNSVIVFLSMAVFLGATGVKEGNDALTSLALFAVIMAFTLMGFLVYNTHPARMFMGDVGSLGIGGAIAGMAVASGCALMLPFMLVTMVISSLSDILQLIYMRKNRGRKLFRMSPYHHHLELGGMPETRIVAVYNVLTLAGCALALILFLRV
ncbi:MAG: phospho-N-acetylmuramoyl-pentapeptide-transferase [Clostridiales bacterium]|nr:phospho-N-acetylmuramoyl-pentapeptide-transferase [Clostridiales bacterium]